MGKSSEAGPFVLRVGVTCPPLQIVLRHLCVCVWVCQCQKPKNILSLVLLVSLPNLSKKRKRCLFPNTTPFKGFPSQPRKKSRPLPHTRLPSRRATQPPLSRRPRLRTPRRLSTARRRGPCGPRGTGPDPENPSGAYLLLRVFVLLCFVLSCVVVFVYHPGSF